MKRKIGVWAACRQIELNPKNTYAYTCRGYAYYAKKDYDKAIKDCTKLIKLYPEEANAYNNRGRTYLWMNEWEKAKNDFVKTIELNNKDSRPYSNLGVYYWKAQKNRQKALDYYEECFKRSFDSWDELYADTGDGHFISDLNKTSEFKALVNKYTRLVFLKEEL